MRRRRKKHLDGASVIEMFKKQEIKRKYLLFYHYLSFDKEYSKRFFYEYDDMVKFAKQKNIEADFALVIKHELVLENKDYDNE